MALLYPFAALSLCCGVVLMLVPEGSLRKTCSLALGLLLTLMWVEALRGGLRLPATVELPDTVLTSSADASGDSGAAMAAWQRIMGNEVCRAIGLSATVTLHADGSVASVVLPAEATADQRMEAANVVHASVGCVTTLPFEESR